MQINQTVTHHKAGAMFYVNFVLVFSYYKIEKDKKFKLIEYPNFVAIINSLSFVGFFDDVI